MDEEAATGWIQPRRVSDTAEPGSRPAILAAVLALASLLPDALSAAGGPWPGRAHRGPQA
ncbi:MAG: hypothetical protein MZV70_50730 [Desulfobacterales bacterium]|nr:hypothetical protein [Desulfobacterales bacterium]